MIDPQLSTGLAGLDRVFQGLMPGDNLVWQVESLHDFKPLVAPFCQAALAQGRKVIYFRFAAHEPLLPKLAGVRSIACGPTRGLSDFSSRSIA